MSVPHGHQKNVLRIASTNSGPTLLESSAAIEPALRPNRAVSFSMIIEIPSCHGENAAPKMFPVDFVKQLIGFVQAEVSWGRSMKA